MRGTMCCLNFLAESVVMCQRDGEEQLGWEEGLLRQALAMMDLRRMESEIGSKPGRRYGRENTQTWTDDKLCLMPSCTELRCMPLARVDVSSTCPAWQVSQSLPMDMISLKQRSNSAAAMATAADREREGAKRVTASQFNGARCGDPL